jgi:hypothetical protein
MTMSFMRGGAPRRKRPAAKRFAELSVVALTHAVEIEGQSLPEGALGTVVAAYRDGTGYEVEFERPFHAVVTLEAGDLTA